ncbi:MAG: VWA domain-containing protein, partial [Acidobacteria bacterium]|nr:VWA domain-containing protein [Candidatus Sulfomarinibacter kjeldsenii]
MGSVPVEAQYEGRVDVNAVVVPVTVRNKAGRVVKGVAPKRFTLYVDGFEVPIRDLDLETDLPISLGFIFDTSGSMMGRKMSGSQQLIMAFLQHRRPDDQLALWTFGDDRVMERFPFGMGWYLLPRVLETLKPWSTTALYDMVLRVPEVLEKARHHRRAAILLTDGVDNASTIDADQAAAVAHRIETPIYVLGVEPPPALASPDGPSFEEILTLIADASGGHYRRIPQAEQMPQVVDELLEELSSRYILTFETSGVGARKWRTIEVTVDGFQATTRSGYTGTL